MKIRIAETKDLPFIMQVELDCFPNDYYTQSLMRRYLLDKNRVIFLVACEGKSQKKVVGYIVAEVNKEKDVSMAEIVSLAVASQHQRQGVGRALLEHAIQTLYDQKKIQQITLQVQKDNYPAKALYSQFHFMLCDPFPGDNEENKQRMMLKKEST